jgi:hypothetical protein
MSDTVQSDQLLLPTPGVAAALGIGVAYAAVGIATMINAEMSLLRMFKLHLWGRLEMEAQCSPAH